MGNKACCSSNDENTYNKKIENKPKKKVKKQKEAVFSPA